VEGTVSPGSVGPGGAYAGDMASRRLRFVAPFAAAGLIAAVATIPSLAGAATPQLPTRTPAQLVARVLTERVDTYSGTLQWSPDLGLPSLGGITSGGGQDVPSASSPTLTGLLSGPASFEVWVDGPSRQRLAAVGTLVESDVVRDGDQAWTWDSATQDVTHYVLAGAPALAPAPASMPPSAAAVSPASLARRILTRLGAADSAVRVVGTARVAGQDVYLLDLSPTGPAAARSTISTVQMAVDAANGMPLQVSVDGRGQSTPALRLGFSSISFAAPAASVFAPPQGSHVRTRLLHPPSRPHRLGAASGGRHRSLGSGWTTVGVLPLGRSARVVDELASVSRAVSGPWGSGRLVSSSLLDALVLPDGQVLVGAVTPATLEADAGLLARS